MIRSTDTAHISPQEWRWLTVTASLLVLLVFAPMIWVALRGTEGWQFMGALHNYLDGATYLSKIQLGYENNWLVTFQHTPEDHAGAFIQVLYLVLGHFARLTALPTLVVFHVARLGAALFMYVALYQFAAVVWSRVRTRRTFFVIASVGSGLGWLFAPLTQNSTFPDLAIPEAFPFFSTLMNVHFPLTIACLALLAALLISAMRPGNATPLTMRYGLPFTALLSLLLSLLYPQALVPVGAAMALYTGMMFARRSPSAPYILRWLLAMGFPALPVAVYIAVTIRLNPTMAAWNAQNITLAPDLPIFLLGFGLPLILAIPGIVRAALRFEGDGDRLMLLWLICLFIAIYLPTSTQRRFAAGMMIPFAYFATRAIEDVWIRYVNRRSRALVYGGLGLLMAVSPFMMLFLPITSALAGYPQAAVGVFLEHDYAISFNWLRDRTSESDVVLAAPVVSAWIPGWTGGRAVYGHPYETLDAEVKEQAVRDWYAAASPEQCAALIEQYQVRYVLYGPEEQQLGAGVCTDSMRLIARTTNVSIYLP